MVIDWLQHIGKLPKNEPGAGLKQEMRPPGVATKCPGGQVECPTGDTCCKMGSQGYGCCTLPEVGGDCSDV